MMLEQTDYQKDLSKNLVAVEKKSVAPPLVVVRDLVKRYQESSILGGVSFSLAPGSSTALLGPSGCGKTTLLHCLGGIHPADGGSIKIGEVFLEGLDAEALAAMRRHHIGTIFQFFYLLPTLSVFENIELPLQLLGKPLDERRERVMELIERVELTHRKEGLPSELSGGEMQRVAIARALVHHPTLILADEPTGNLDSLNGSKILDLLQELVKEEGVTLFMVTHSEVAAKGCSQVLRMKDGVLQ